MFKGSKIREQRKIVGLSQENLAEKISTHVNTIRRWEKGKQAPDINSLIQVADVLHITAAYLSGETDKAVLQEGITHQNPALDSESMDEKRLIIRNNEYVCESAGLSRRF